MAAGICRSRLVRVRGDRRQRRDNERDGGDRGERADAEVVRANRAVEFAGDAGDERHDDVA